MTLEAGGSEVTTRLRRHRRYSTEFKLRLVEAYLTGEGSAHELWKEHGVPHKIAAVERKVGQLTMALDLLKKGLAVAPPASNGSSSIISGPGASPSREDVA